MSQPLPPFSCTYSPNFPELLSDLNCSLAITTYQAGKLVFLSPQDRTRMIQLPRTFEKPMGMAIRENDLAVATRDHVVTFRNAPSMAANFPKYPNTYDALFLPRATYHTGELDIHDLFFVQDKLVAVNTQFSCLAEIDGEYNFKPIWQPPFLTGISPNDQCHLNGIAIREGKPAFATALGDTTESKGWRKNKVQGGVLIDIEKNTVIANGLAMPHSPRWYNSTLYVLLSATGELSKIDVNTGLVTVLKEFNGFVRGMDKIGDYLFIGLSKLRESSATFADLPIAQKSIFAGVVVVHQPTMAVVAQVRYETSVEEIYDVKVLPGILRPTILTPDKGDHRMAVTTPHDTFWAIAVEKS